MAEGSYRLTPPHPGMYETSPGEQAVLRSIDLKNLGGMYGMLLGQRADTESRQQAYGDQLQQTNTMQANLARDQLAEAGRQADGTLSLGFVKEGLGLPEGLIGARIPGLQVQPSASTGPNILRAQALRELASRSKSVADMGTGIEKLMESGVTLNTGQAVDRPEDAINLRSTTERPLRERLEGMQQAGANGRARLAASAGDDGTEFKIKIDPLSQMPTLEQKKGSLPQQAYYASAFNKWVAGGGFRRGEGFNPPPYTGPGASAAVPAPAPRVDGNMGTARGATPLTQQGTPPPSVTPQSDGTAPPSVVERARKVPGSQGVLFSGGKWYAITPGGKRTPLE